MVYGASPNTTAFCDPSEASAIGGKNDGNCTIGHSREFSASTSFHHFESEFHVTPFRKSPDGDDFSRVTERNLDALIGDMVVRCSGIFSRASGAVTRESKSNMRDSLFADAKLSEESAVSEGSMGTELIRERLVIHEDKVRCHHRSRRIGRLLTINAR